MIFNLDCIDSYISLGWFACQKKPEGLGYPGKPDFYKDQIQFKSSTGLFDVEIQPIEIEEKSFDYQKEIERFEKAITYIEDALNIEVEAEEEIKQIYLVDRGRALEYILLLIEQIFKLRGIKRKREDEEVIIAILIAED